MISSILCNKGLLFCIKETKQHKIGSTLQIMANPLATAELKNHKIENPFCLFQILVQYVGSNGLLALKSHLGVSTGW